MAEEVKVPRRFLSTREIIFGVILVILFGGSFALTLNSYIQEGSNNQAPTAFSAGATKDFLAIDAKVLSIDPVKGEMAVRMDLTPQGALTDDGGYSSPEALKVYVNTATGQAERVFDAGKTISPFDAVISLDGQVNDYPFDKYTSQMYVYVTSQASKDAEEVEVPVELNFTASVPGYAISAAEDKEGNPTNQLIDVDASRSNTVMTVAIAGMAIMWAIGIAVIFLTMSFVFRNRKAEAFAFYSGLLFGLFGLRNSLPGTPPIGTQSDFLSFLWVEAIVAIMMVVTIVISLNRPQK
jgi:hypothetical protein